MENKISFSVQMTGALNYAMQQNYIPVVRSIILTNNTHWKDNRCCRSGSR